MPIVTVTARRTGRNVLSGQPAKRARTPIPDAPAIRRSARDRRAFVPFTGDIPPTTPKRTPKKETPRGAAAKVKKTILKKGKGGKKKEVKGRKKEEKGKKKAKEPKVSKKGNDRLVPRLNINVPKQHPLLLGKADYVSWRSLPRNLLAATLKKDLKEMGKVLDDKRLQNDAGCVGYSSMDKRCAVVEALASGNDKLADTLMRRLKEVAEREKTFVVEPNLLERKSSGRSNFYMLGRATRAVEASRGGREGNNAFLNYEPMTICGGFLPLLIERNVPYSTLSALAEKRGLIENYFSRQELSSAVVVAMRMGHRELASHLAEEAKHFFNQLQLESLKKNGKFPSNILAVSVRKKSFMNRNITPCHTAAINPDASFLSALRDVDPLVNVPDQNNWYTIHYAAVCEGTGPLEFLLSMNTPVLDLTKQGELPLHVAARAGRKDNVALLLKAIGQMEKNQKEGDEGEEEEEEEDEPRAKKAKKTSAPKSLVNAKTRKGRTPLHYAVYHGCTDVVKVFIANEAVDKECTLSANDKKLTPLMIAAGRGHLDICELLISNGCLIEAKDKLKRSPLILAVMNGQQQVVAMLLQKGADVHRKDTSGNTSLHYACAYGWLEAVKLLVEVDPTTLSAKNEWLLSPLSVAYLKGHYGIVSWLLDSPHSALVDINSKDNNGITLISSLIGYHDASSTIALPAQIDYLIKNGADCSIPDTAGNTPLHVFAAVPIVLNVANPTREIANNDKRITSKQYRECLERLISAGGDPKGANADGATPFQVALDNGNLFLASQLFDMQDVASFGQAKEQNLLHSLFALPFVVQTKSDLWAYSNGPLGGQYNVVPLLKKITEKVGVEKVREWLGEAGREGATPIYQVALAYSTLRAESMDGGHFSSFSSTISALLREAFALLPNGVLQRKAVKAEEKDNYSPYQMAEIPSIIKFALTNCNLVKGEVPKNLLLTTMLDVATTSGHLKELLTMELYEKSHRGKTTPLLWALMEKRELDAIDILDAATAAGIQKEIGGQKVEVKLKKEGEEDEEEEEEEEDRVAPVTYGGFNRFGRGGMRRPKISRHPPPTSTPSANLLIEVPWNRTSFHIAVDLCLLKVLPHLVLTKEQSAEEDSEGNNAWHLAAAHLQPSTILLFQRLLADGVPIKANHAGLCPLHVAVNAEKTASADAFLDPIEWLVDHCDAAVTDSLGRTALHYAFAKKDEKEVKHQDPIAVVSLLLNKATQKTIRHVDSEGNTALHLAAKANANICIVTLLAKGSEVDALNVDGNSPLALALLSKSLASALTLIQARAAISGPVLGPLPRTKEMEKWRLLSDPVEEVIRFTSTIAEAVVRNEWHSLVYVILGLLGKTPETIGKLVSAALQNGQHNFAIYLLKLFGTPSPDKVSKWDFLILYTESLPSAPLVGPSLTVLNMILDLGVKFIDAKGRSVVIEKAAEKGHFDLIQILKERDPAGYARLSPSSNGFSPIRALVQRWIDHPSDHKRISPLLTEFFSLGGLDKNSPIAAPRPALPGFPSPRCPHEMEEVTPLARAIDAHCPSLVHFLASSGVDFEEGGKVPPLLRAVATNNYAVVKALVDIELVDNKGGKEERKDKAPFGGAQFVVGQVNGINGDDDSASSGGGSEDDEASEASNDQNMENGEENGEEEEDEDQNKHKEKKFEIKWANTDLNFAGVDGLGRNVLHYLVAPCGWENVELLRAMDKGANGRMRPFYTAKDSSGHSPMDMAAAARQFKLHREMVKLSKSAFSPLPPLPVSLAPSSTLDVSSDARALLAEFGNVVLKKNKKGVDPRVPDARTGYEETGLILECGETKQLFKALLNKTDMRGGLFGFHNYYRMELVKRKDTDLFVLFTNWGRIGDATGEFQCTPFTRREDAEKEFRSVWKQKTGQEWLPLAAFNDKPGKYRITKVEVGAESAADIEVEPFVVAKADEKNLALRVIEDISNVKMLRGYARAVRLYNNTKASCPFGKIAKEEIDKGFVIIGRLKKIIESIEKERGQRPVNTEKLLRLTDEMYQETSSFYSTIPVGGFGFTEMQVITNGHELQFAENLLHSLSDIEIAGRFVCAAAYGKLKKKADPIRYLFDALECDLTALEPSSLFSQRLVQWIRASSEGDDSQGRPQVVGLYSIAPRSPAQAFQKHANSSNITFLLHGTKAENLLSILKYGLQATPSNALACGQIWGSGVYFADSFEKSRGYCGASKTGVNYMLVCKVALGQVWEKNAIGEKSKFDTRKVEGTTFPDPDGSITIDGCTMPLGKTKKAGNSYYTAWNEFIVKDQTRILPSHILAFK